ncbi:nuclear transport factor 2 family protein [Gordonia hydrophobica]|uniref:Nuclear transport factor 2 family protein n=1 Tax=Gordonia hydrophobica TaxID=40516 RepID=A0ABZ2U3Z0_9ACTN|nr:nuclear transport factor 2 family protein [Gordonia hydrophobica]MBM7367299.1 hypothetical protein [Gordonia hydrophobica]
MHITLPTDCGNAPRIGIVSEFVTSWASRDAEAMTAWLTDDVSWTIGGRQSAGDEAIADVVCPAEAADYLEVSSVITHGRLASCDGFLESGSSRVHFSHVFRFASTSKAAKIKEARTYLVEWPGSVDSE